MSIAHSRPSSAIPPSGGSVRPADPAIEDRLCLARIAEVDPAAVGELYDRYGRVVFGVVQRIVDDRDVAGALTADAFHAAAREARSYRSDGGSVRTWLLGITRRVALEWCREHGHSSFDDASAVGSRTRRLVERRSGGGEQMEPLDEAITMLAPEQHRLLSFAFWSGLTDSGIATRIGIARDAVRADLRIGMLALGRRVVGR